MEKKKDSYLLAFGKNYGLVSPFSTSPMVFTSGLHSTGMQMSSPSALRMHLGERGWVLPGEVIDKIDFWISADIDEKIASLYFEENAKVFNKTIEIILDYLENSTCRQQVEDAQKAYFAGLYCACCYTLAPVIGSIVEDQSNKGSTKIKKLFDCKTYECREFLLSDPRGLRYLGVYKFMRMYTMDSDFNGCEPKDLNRHWLMHGRYKNRTFTKYDGLKLFSALSGLSEVLLTDQ